MSSTHTASIMAYIRWLTAQTPLLNSWPQNSGACDIFLGCVILNNVNAWCAPNRSITVPLLSGWQLHRGKGPCLLLFPVVFHEQLKGLTLNRRFSLNDVCWKEGREGGRGDKKIPRISVLIKLWLTQQRPASFSPSISFPCWAYILTTFPSLLLARWSSVTENERGYRLRWYVTLPGLALKNFPQSLCPSLSLRMAVDQLPSVQRATLRAWEIRSPSLEGA